MWRVSGSQHLPAHQVHINPGRDTMMVKVEDIQQYGKEHLETVVASATSLQNGFQAIASAYGDYTKKSFEDTKSAYETFVAESQKIAGLYTDLAKQTFKPIEGMVAKFAPAATH